MAETTRQGGEELRPGDDGREGDAALSAWALATFHAATLLLVPLTLAHVVAPDALGDLLAGLDTLVGLALFLVLWGATWWTNRRYLAACAFADAGRTLAVGARWGAVTGLPLLGCVVVAAFVATNPTFAALVLVAGGLVAPLVGAVVGALFAAFDVALDRAAAALVS
ncbi:hypothetical protein [Salinigranum halophilum]|uniref:hypothetical protein n=1 Tax=Salinigranum halophilum TaxID=2565931 RepID=UPI0010A85802|nr:hypothetical protein [Salinigranum halophilum]